MFTEIEKFRKVEFSIHPIILNRWSPRSMTGEQMSDEELMPLFEAARWAPSSFNNQPWRFFYAKRETEHWERFFDLLIDFNKDWCKNASVLIVAVSYMKHENKDGPCRTHSFDTGAAWQNLALEGASRGYVVHGIEGFDYEKAKTMLRLPIDYQVEAMIAVGKRAPVEQLSSELQKREVPSGRKPISEISSEGGFQT